MGTINATTEPSFHCFILEDDPEIRRILVAWVEKMIKIKPQAFNEPNQMADYIDRLHQDPQKKPILVLSDGSMIQSDYRGTVTPDYQAAKMQPYLRDVSGTLSVLADKHKQGNIGNYLVALFSGDVNSSFGGATPLDDLINNRSIKLNPGDVTEAIRIQKPAGLQEVMTRLSEYASKVFKPTQE